MLLATLLASLLAMGACSGPSDRELLASARSYIDKKDTAAAVIELKNLLQKNPKSGEARFLLGKLLAESGDSAGAETHLRQALEAGYPEDEVMPLLARTMLSLQKSGPLLLQYGTVELKNNLAAAEFKTQLAAAHVANKSLAEAQTEVDNALRRTPGYPPAVVLGARLMAAQGDVASALGQVEDLLGRVPGDAPAWTLKGDLLLRSGRGNLEPAGQAYRQAVSLKPDYLPAHQALMSMLIDQRRFDEAALQFESLKKALPRHPETQYYEAVLALQKGQAQRVREITEGLLRGPQPDPRVLMLAGQAEIQLNALTQAEALLGKAIQLAPKAAPPRRMLAQLLLRTGQADKALAVIKPLLEAGTPDAGLLALLGRAQLMMGDAKSAEASFAQASRLNPNDKRLQSSAALSRLGQGKAAAALTELESLAATDAGTTADLALISERLRQGQFDAALKAIDGLAAKQPKLALPDMLRGRIAMQRRNVAAARISFESALAKEPGLIAAVASLAALDVADGKPDAARARFEAVLKRDPSNTTAHLALADLAQRRGAGKEEVARMLERAVAANPGAASSRTALVDFHSGHGDTALALAAAQTAVAALPSDPDLLDRLGRIQQAMGDINQAIPTFGKLAALQPRSALPQLRLADAHMANKDPEAAAKAVRRATEAEPTSLAAQRAAITMALREKRPAQALAVARGVQSQRPGESVGYVLEGEVEFAAANFDGAAAAFRKVLGKADAGDVAPKLHQALSAAKKDAEAQRMADEWLRSHPQDLTFGLYLGDSEQALGKFAQAELRYREVLKRAPGHVPALNNLAYLLARQQKPGAVALAENAVKLAPDQPPLMDTLALSYAEENQLDKALAVQTRVVALAPQVGDFRLRLAKLQLRAGNKQAARAELQKLSDLGKAYAAHEEVTQLLKGSGS
jgi:putative PEP-CTERM system TPR-repeat lipoprotein